MQILMKIRSLAAAAACGLGLLSLLWLGPVRAGGSLDTFDYTGLKPSPIPGQILGTTTPYRHDDRCMPIHFRMNTTRDPVAQGPDGTQVTLAAARAAIEQAMDSWNRIPTSYIEMRMVGTTANPGLYAFDFINEASFNWLTTSQASGLARSITLAIDSLLEHGDDIDGDGDTDVSSAILTCQDADGDGDIEFPAGLYKAGTILDTDIRFNPAVTFHLDVRLPSYQSLDLVGVAAHELGHGHGLAHSNIVQKSVTDGTSATMHCCDPAIGRQLHSDDIAWSSFLYPEGSRKSGLGALQPGDFAFDQRYSVIRGQVRNANNLPIAGAFVTAEDLQGRPIASAIGGRVQVSVGGGLPFQYLPPSLGGLADGDYSLPVPKGIYRVAVEPNDGWPEGSYVNENGFVGFLFGNQNFVREYYNGPHEWQIERNIGHALPVPALHDRKGIDFRLDNNVQLFTFNADDSPADVPIGPQGSLRAVRIPRADILAVNRGRGLLLQAALFGTLPFYTWEVARFDAAMITSGRVAGDGTVTIDLAHPLVKRAPFVGADRDLTPLYVEHSRALGLYAEKVLPVLGKDLFVVLAFSKDSADPDFPEFSKYSILVDFATPDRPARGTSYASNDGGLTWHREDFADYSFGLVVAPR